MPLCVNSDDSVEQSIRTLGLRCPRVLRFVAALAAILWCSQCHQADAQATWEYSPYLIHVWLETDAAEVPASRHAELCDALIERADTVHGAAWNLSVAAPPASLRTQIRSSIGQISAAEIEASASESLAGDKLLLISIERSTGWFEVQAREFDCRTKQWSLVFREKAPASEALPLAIWSVVNRVFTPLARIESVDGRTVIARLRAAGLVTDPQSALLVPPQAVLRPIVRRNDREGQPVAGGIQTPDWSLLEVSEVEGTELKCRLFSGYRNPIPTKGGRRTERYALLVRPSWPNTRLVLMSRTTPSRSLGGYQIYRFEHSDQEPERIGVTEIDGSLTLPATDGRLQTLLVRSGTQLLARLPVVPGQAAELVAHVVDDDGRLQAEGFVLAFQSRVMDLVARRELVAAEFRQNLAAGDLKAAQAQLDEYRLLESRGDLSRVLDQEQQEITSRDRTTQVRIQKLFADARKLLLKYLDPEAGNRMARDLAAARARGPVATPASDANSRNGESLAAPPRP